MSARKQLERYLADKRVKLIHDSVKTAFESRDFIAHNWDHIYRDTINAIRIGEVLTYHFMRQPASLFQNCP